MSDAAVPVDAEPVDIDARLIVRSHLARTVFVEAGAGAGKTRELVERIVALVISGVPLGQVAAITFTEKAAAELQDRIRAALEARAVWGGPEAERCRVALDDLDDAHFQTLHAFAQSLLAAHPTVVGLPPIFEVIDEVEAGIDFEARWGAFVDDLLSAERDTDLMTMAYVLGATVNRLRDLATQFDEHWDLLVDAPAWLRDADPTPVPAIDTGPLLVALDAVLDARSGCRIEGDKLLTFLDTVILRLRDRLAGAASTGDLIEVVDALATRKITSSNGRAGNWTGPTKADVVDLLADAEVLAARALDGIALPILQAVCPRTRAWVLAGAAERREAGRLQFHDLLVLARDLLLQSPAALEAVRADITHLFVDEFQDTDPLQIELAVLIGGASDSAGVAWPAQPVREGALFFVGDPKQSIYRFRRADMTVYRAARDRFEDDLVELRTNFRSVEAVLDWLNAVFGALLGGPSLTQAPWTPLASHRRSRSGARAAVVLGSPIVGKVAAARVRELEAADVAAACRAAVSDPWMVPRSAHDPGEGPDRPVRYDDIAILLPTRTSLPAIERALEAAAIPYRVESRSLLWATQEVRDLIGVARAADDPSDQVAVVAALRSPLLGCDDPSLLEWRAAGGRWNPTAPRPEDLPPDQPVAHAMATIARWHGERWSLAPDEMIARMAEGCHAFALAYGRPRQRESWHRIRFVIDQARAFADGGGASLRHFIDWAERQAEEGATALETVVPEPDDRAVRIMTVHAAKGLEFGVCVVAGLSGTGSTSRMATVVWGGDGIEVRVGPMARRWETPDFPQLRAEEVQLEADEQMRLLYVACTRACDHLVVSLWHAHGARVDDRSCLAARASDAIAAAAGLHRRLDGGEVDLAPVGVADLAAVEAPPTAPPVGQMTLPMFVATPVPDEESLEVWLNRRGRDIDRAAALTVSATGLGDDGDDVRRPALTAEVVNSPGPGGPGGSAFGRAVHRVLQAVDLGDHADLGDLGDGDPAHTTDMVAALAAAHAAAEGLADQASAVADTVTAARGAPIVAEAVQSGRWWREVSVGAEVEGVLIEGVIDLLFETPEGLVIVDYKTDVVSDAGLDAAVDHHERQLAAYALVLEATQPKPVVRAVLVFLDPGGVRQRQIADVEAAKQRARRALVTIGAS